MAIRLKHPGPARRGVDLENSVQSPGSVLMPAANDLVAPRVGGIERQAEAEKSKEDGFHFRLP